MSKIEILTYVLAVIGSIASFASAASVLVPKDSTLGLWLAWFASMPIKHRPAKQVVETTGKDVTVKRITLGSLFVAFLVLPGCAGTFEEARLAQPGALQASPVRVSSSRCVALSDRGYWFDVAAVGTGSTGVGAVIAAIPATDKSETALMIAGVSAASASIVFEIASNKAGTQYVKEGCAK
jgi:hypothetical protein